MGLFGDIKNARGSQGGAYPVPGMYKVQINRCKQAEDRKHVAMFITEFKIIESSNEERPVGTTMDWVVKFDKDPALGNVKEFMEQAMKCWLVEQGHFEAVGDIEIGEEEADRIVSENNPLVGMMIQVEAYSREIKSNPGKFFTRMKWDFTAEQKAKLQAAGRKAA